MKLLSLFDKKDFFYLDDGLQRFAFRSLLRELMNSPERRREKFLSQLRKRDLLSSAATSLFLSAETASEVFFLQNFFSSISLDRDQSEAVLLHLERVLFKDEKELTEFSQRARETEKLLLRLLRASDPKRTEPLSSLFTRALQTELFFGEGFEPSKRILEAVISAAEKAQRQIAISLGQSLLDRSVEFLGHELDLTFFLLERLRQLERKDLFSVRVGREVTFRISRKASPLQSLRERFSIVNDAETEARKDLGPFFQTIERLERARSLVVFSYVLKLTQIEKERISFTDEGLSVSDVVRDFSLSRKWSLTCSAWADEAEIRSRREGPLDVFARSILLIRSRSEPPEAFYSALAKDVSELVRSRVWTADDVRRLIQSLPRERQRRFIERLPLDLQSRVALGVLRPTKARTL